MADERTNRPFSQEVPRLLAERGMSLRGLAREVGVSDAHLSRVLRGVRQKTPSPDLARRVAAALELPDDYFGEYREAIVIEHVRRDARIRDELYDRLRNKLR